MPEEPNKKSTGSDSAELRDEQLKVASGGGVESVSVKYTMFNPNGAPVRSDSNSDGSKMALVDNLKEKS